MSAHTPGPWQVNGSHVYSADPDRALLVQVFNPGSKESDHPLRQNARLIAAAPDLLAALQAMTEIAELTIGWFPTPEDADGPLIQARAAIAKATGA